MRIGIVSHVKYPIREPFAGGLEMHTHILASKLQERGNDVTLFAAEGSTVPGTVPICTPTAPTADDAAAFRMADAKEHVAYLRCMDLLRVARFDVVHNNSLHHLPLAMAGMLDAPMVTTLHTPPFSPLGAAVRVAARQQQQFVSISHTISEQWIDHLTVRDMIPNGVDLSRFTFHPRPSPAPYAVWYGRIVPEKGLHFAIDAARLAGLTLRFAGPILDKAYFDEFIAPRLGADTRYEGHLDHRHLSELIGLATVFLCTPCWEEPYGLVVAEALASGVPVAAFARGAVPRIVDSDSGALAEPDDARSLADAVLRAIGLSRSACRRRAEKICDVELMIDGYVDLYARCAGLAPFPIPLVLPSAPPALAL